MKINNRITKVRSRQRVKPAAVQPVVMLTPYWGAEFGDYKIVMLDIPESFDALDKQITSQMDFDKIDSMDCDKYKNVDFDKLQRQQVSKR